MNVATSGTLAALDVDSRMVVSLVVGKRTQDNLEQVVADFADRSGGSPPS